MSKPINPTLFKTEPLPMPDTVDHENCYCTAVTLRDLFAAVVAGGLMANADYGGDRAHTAKYSYELADNLLAERGK